MDLRGQVGRHAAARRRRSTARCACASRSERDVTANFPELAGLAELAPDVLLDGEVVLLERGVPSFAALADRMHAAGRPRAPRPGRSPSWCSTCCGSTACSLLDRPLAERRATLERLELAAVPNLVALARPTPTAPRCWRPPRQRGHGGRGGQAPATASTGRAAAARTGSKATHRTRRPAWSAAGGRSAAAPSRIGALLLGVPDGAGLRYAGRVGVRAGRDDARSGCCASGSSTREQPPFAERLPRPDDVGARWCEPQTVVEVAHTGLDRGGRLRHPVYRGVRDDLDPEQVSRADELITRPTGRLRTTVGAAGVARRSSRRPGHRADVAVGSEHPGDPLPSSTVVPVTTMLTWQAEDGHGLEGARVSLRPDGFRRPGPDGPAEPR